MNEKPPAARSGKEGGLVRFLIVMLTHEMEEKKMKVTSPSRHLNSSASCPLPFSGDVMLLLKYVGRFI